MRFLKKASYKDIIGNAGESQFHYYEDLSAKYKEFELFLTGEDLNDLLNNKEKFECLNKTLKKNGAVITVIHCPESRFKTCNEKENELSSNYLSLCEVIGDEVSQAIFKNLLQLADKLCQAQYKDDNDEDANDGKKKNNSIIVILHEGCSKGCVNNFIGEDFKCDNYGTKVADVLIDLNIQSSIQIAIENVTPFYSITNSEMKIGDNCGWKKDNQLCKKDFFEKINEKLKDTTLQIGACIDFCHIMVSSKIVSKNEAKVEAIENYLEDIDYSDYIFLFHVSNYGGDLSHGKLFSFENEEDKKAIEEIRKSCNTLAPKAPITFEMTDGTDIEKASLNYEHIMFYFNSKHLFGRFSELLNNNENIELKEFFDELFVIYSYDKKSVFEITNALWCVKQIILKNTSENQERKERLFSVDFDKTEVNLSLVRLKAYVYYTRFCNLGNYLAENYYSGDKCIWSDEKDIAKDFGLSMKYFIFNDKIHQCVYTGIQYKFLIDFLPKKESFVRFNDGITTVKEMEIQSDNVFKEVISKIPGHINGDSIREDQVHFFSVGKNFAQCLFKYFDSNHIIWSVRIYENVPINYVDYRGKKYSIQAFAQLVLTNKDFITKDEKVDLSLDISRFASGRDGKNTDTLEGFLKYFGNDLGLAKEKVASIADGEILFTNLQLPECKDCYLLNEIEGMILKKICLGMIGKSTDRLPNKLVFNDASSDSEDNDAKKKIEEAIKYINNDKKHKIWQIIDKMKENLCNSNMESQELVGLNTYSGNDNKIYEQLSKYVYFVREDKEENE